MNALLIVAMLFLQAGDPATHRVTFSSGRTLDCRVEEEGDRDLYLRIDSAKMRIPKTGVRRIERLDLPATETVVVAEVPGSGAMPEAPTPVDELLARLSGDELTVAVGKLAPEEARHLIRRMDSLEADARAAALAGLAKLAVDVRKLLSSSHADVRRAAALLMKTGPTDLERLAEAALDRDAGVRTAAVESALSVAARTGSESTLASLWLRHLPRGSDAARTDLAGGLGRLASRVAAVEIRAALESLLTDRSAAVRCAAAAALAESRGSIDALVKALPGETETGVAVRICEALGRSGLTSAIEPLREALRSHEAAVRKAAVQALTLITRRAPADQ